MRRVPLILMIVSIAVPVWGVSYHVAKTGSDAPALTCAIAQTWSTNPANAKLTVQAGVNCLQPGDALYIHAGTYVEATITTAVSGTASQRITITAWSGESPRLDGSLIVSHSFYTVSYMAFIKHGVVVNNGADDLQFLHFSVTDHPGQSIRIDANNGDIFNVLFEDCVIRNSGTSGIAIATVEPAEVPPRLHNLTVRRCQILNTGEDALGTVHTETILFEDNYIDGTGEDGIDIKATSEKAIIRRNTIRNTQQSCIMMNRAHSDTPPPFTSGVTEFDIDGNDCEKTVGTLVGSAGIRVNTKAPETGSHRSKIRNNVVKVLNPAAAATDGISIFRGSQVDLLNNTIYLTGSNARWGILGRCYRDGVIKNNIVVGPDKAFSAEGSSSNCTGYENGLLTEDYNTLRTTGARLIRWTNGTNYTTLAAYQSATGQGLHSITSDPLFVNAPADLHLLDKSPAIGAVDMGAYPRVDSGKAIIRQKRGARPSPVPPPRIRH